MKIKIYIDEGICIEREVPESLNLEQLKEIRDSFNKYIDSGNKDKKEIVRIRPKTYGKRTWCNSKEKAVNILKIHFYGTKDDRKIFANNNDIYWSNVNISDLKSRYVIRPEDVRLKKFPEQYQFSGAIANDDNARRQMILDLMIDPNEKIEFSTACQLDTEGVNDMPGKLEYSGYTYPGYTEEEGEKFEKKLKEYLESSEGKETDRKIKEEMRSRGSPRPITRFWCDTKDKALNIFRVHYFGSKEEKLKLSDNAGVDWDEIVKGMNGLKHRYNIQPEEIGLLRFPTRMDRKIILLHSNGGDGNATPTLNQTQTQTQIKAQYPTYPMSELSMMTWDKLEELSFEWGVNVEVIKGCKLNDDKDSLIIELRKEMRQYENVQKDIIIR